MQFKLGSAKLEYNNIKVIVSYFLSIKSSKHKRYLKIIKKTILITGIN